MGKKNDEDNIKYIFLNSTTFKIWQFYCNIRDRKINYRKTKKDFITIDSKLLEAKTFKIWYKSYIIRLYVYKKTINPIYVYLKNFTPKPIKDSIKGIILILVSIGKKEIIDNDIKLEWNRFSRKRNKNQKDIIIFGIIAYGYRHQRPQHLAEQLAKKGHRIFYVENDFIPQGLTKEPKIKVTKIKEKIYIVNLASIRNIFIYKDTPSLKDKKTISESLKLLIREANIINPIAKIDHPFWGNLLKEIAMPVIYDCMDEHSGFKESSYGLNKHEQKLFDNSDLVLVSSQWLLNKARQNNVKNVLILRNAGEYEHFSSASSNKLPVPDELKNIKKPIIGYYGAISSWFDIKILEDLAIKFENVSIVLIGRIDNNGVIKLSKKYRNIYLLGEKTYLELPKYLQEFDVCTIPFQITDLIKATNPVKIYEYLAAGKPVVATNIPELKVLGDVVYIANNKDEFIKEVSLALNEKDGLAKKRQKVSKENTWEIRGNLLTKTINTIFNPKVSVIVVSYKNLEFIKKCLYSVINRSFYPNLEVVVVDNASDKKTLKLLVEYEKSSEIVVVRNKKNIGFAAGNNIGLKAASGEYLILLNNDTIVTPGWIDRLIYHANKNKVSLVGPVTNNIGNEAKIDIFYDANDYSDIEGKSHTYISNHWGDTLEVNNIAAFAWIMKRSLYKKVGEMDERFGRGLFEDDDYCIRVRKLGKKILIADDVFVHHWGGGTTKWQTRKYQNLFNENKKKFEDKWELKWTPHKYREDVK